MNFPRSEGVDEDKWQPHVKLYQRSKRSDLETQAMIFYNVHDNML